MTSGTRAPEQFAIEQLNLDEHTHLVKLSGEIDFSNLAELKAAFDAAAGSGRRRIIIDLSRVTFVDSTFLGLVALTSIRAKARQASAEIICRNPNVLRAFDAAGLTPSLRISSQFEGRS